MLTCTFSMMPSHSAASLLYSSKSEVELLFADSLASLLQDSFRFQNLRYFLTDADNSSSSSSSNSDSDTSSSDARDEEGRRVNGLAEEAEGGEGAVVTEEGPGGRGTPFSAPPGTPPFLWRVQQLDRRMESADLALAIEELGGIPGKPSVHGSGGKLQVHMCGPPSMIDATEAELSALGVPADQVHFERWW